MTKIQPGQEITKADLEMAVFLSRGEVDRYRIMLEHDIRAYELMNPEIAKADTIKLPMRGLLTGPHLPAMPTSRGVYSPADALSFVDDVITHVDGDGRDTGETGHVYERPET
jgi:hypothetical protein